MAFVIADRVRETTTTTGTGAVTLAGAYISFQSFSAAIGDGNNTYYTIVSPTTGEWEVGIGTYTSSTNSLSRDTVLSSSNSGSLVSFTAGTKDVFVTQPSERSLLINSASNGLFAGNAAFTSNGVLYANSTTGITSGSALTFDGTTLATTTLDATNLEVTNVKALDGTAAFSIASSTGVVTIDDTKFTLQDETDNTKKAQFQLSSIATATARTYTLQNASGTVALLSGSQTFSGATTFSSTFTLSGTTTNISLGASQTTGTWTAGGTAQTGAITLGQSTGAQTLNLGTGATTTATTKTINLGTAGVSGSTTAINIGSAVSGAVNTITINGNPTLSGGTANGVLYLDGSKVATSGSALTFNGTTLSTTAFTASADSSFTSTGALTISKGTTAQQPGSPATGMIRYNTTTNQFEGYSGASPAWKSIGGSALSNDTSTASNLYPTFAGATTGTAENLYTSNAKLLYKPSTGEFQASVPVASNGIFVNSQTVAASYTIAAGYSAMSAGPVTVASGQSVTVASGSRWVVV